MGTLKINGVIYGTKVHQNVDSLPYLFMLHGFMGDGHVFDHLTDNLCKACNPVTVDLLGHGKSKKVHDPDRYGEEQQIADIIELVEQTVDTSPTLYGYSMGGRLALKTALQAPEAFAGLILESTNYGIMDDGKRADRRQADARRAREIRKNYPAFLAEWEQLPLFKSPLKTDEKLENSYKKIHLSQDPKAMAASLVGFGTGNMKPVCEAITHYKNPAMIIAGTGDQKYMKISQSLTSYFDQALFCPIPAGHRVHLDNPLQLCRELSHFINQNLPL